MVLSRVGWATTLVAGGAQQSRIPSVNLRAVERPRGHRRHEWVACLSSWLPIFSHICLSASFPFDPFTRIFSSRLSVILKTRISDHLSSGTQSCSPIGRVETRHLSSLARFAFRIEGILDRIDELTLWVLSWNDPLFYYFNLVVALLNDYKYFYAYYLPGGTYLISTRMNSTSWPIGNHKENHCRSAQTQEWSSNFGNYALLCERTSFC